MPGELANIRLEAVSSPLQTSEQEGVGDGDSHQGKSCGQVHQLVSGARPQGSNDGLHSAGDAFEEHGSSKDGELRAERAQVQALTTIFPVWLPGSTERQKYNAK